MKQSLREARRWSSQAEDDLKFAKWIAKEKHFFDKGCFITQQAGEKILKACLYASGERQVFGHSLYELAQDLVRLDSKAESIVDQAKLLDRFYIPTRYPNGLPGGVPFQTFGENDLQDAISSVEKIFAFCKHFLRKVESHSE
jgi:HEPN domain-containing protein